MLVAANQQLSSHWDSLRVDPLFQKKKGSFMNQYHHHHLRNKEQKLATAAQLNVLILFSNHV